MFNLVITRGSDTDNKTREGDEEDIDLDVKREDNSAASARHKTQGTTNLCNFQFFNFFNIVPFVNAGISGRLNLVPATKMVFYFSI